MINFNNIDNRVPVTPTPAGGERRGHRTAATENANNNKRHFVERRKNPDRRTRSAKRHAFERRVGGDRRRSSIDISV